MPSSSSPPASLPKMKSLVIGISGPSSSGKTSLARLLRKVFDGIQTSGSEAAAEEDLEQVKVKVQVKVTVMHQDDFYLPDEE